MWRLNKRELCICFNLAFVYYSRGVNATKIIFSARQANCAPKRLVLSSLHELHVKNMLRRKNIRLFHVYVYARLRIQRYSHGVVLLFPLLIIPCVLGFVQVVSLVAQCM